MPGLLDFVLYCASDAINDEKLYDKKTSRTLMYGIGYDVLYKFQKQQIKVINEQGISSRLMILNTLESVLISILVRA